MSKQLIVNADDYALTPSVSRGIIDAHLKGIVTSTTVMVGYPNAEADLAIALEKAPHLGLGLHFVLTGNMPPVSAPGAILSLVPGAWFHVAADFPAAWQRIDPDDIETEMIAQFDRFRQLTGRLPDHLDSHHHVTYLNPAAFRVMVRIAQQHHIPIRSFGLLADDLAGTIRQTSPALDPAIIATIVPLIQEQFTPDVAALMPAGFDARFFGDGAILGELLLTLVSLPDGVTEMMCHPGYVDDQLKSSYRDGRASELAHLIHRSTIETVKSEGIALVRFGDLAR